MSTGLVQDDRIRLTRGDITRLSVDATVNLANASRPDSGGIDGAINRAVGPDLLAEYDIGLELRDEL